MARNKSISVPKSIKFQISRLFGENSKEAKKDYRTDSEWKKILKKVLDELYKYFEENVDSDGLHTLMLYSCFDAANESLKEDNFWPGYVEGIIRLSFLLMGEYPDHRRRKGGKRKKEHYNLKRSRSLVYVQNMNQRLNTLLLAGRLGFIKLSKDPREVLTDFRHEKGFSATYKEFFSWFKKHYPTDYAAIF
ncbi:MAG: hypothetical protein FJ134_10200 [Deltaproteobacteria bacterium]|nr:hypothetical protein [Deltaproteobacteria bacterium]